MKQKTLLILISLVAFFSVSMNPVAVVSEDTLDPFSNACSSLDPNSADYPASCQADGSVNPVSGKDGIISKAIGIFSYIIAVASVIMILFGSFKYITAGGESKNVSTAKSSILYALIGIVVFLLSRAIITFVINKL